jgi:site-specific DNA-methyltransferase (cytosine-N4-specific)
VLLIHSFHAIILLYPLNGYVNTVWWLSKEPHPKANNRKVLKPYSKAMLNLLKNGYEARLRPSGHDISTKFKNDRGGAIPPNIINAQDREDSEIGDILFWDENNPDNLYTPVSGNVISASNTSSNDYYQKRCQEEGIKRHPARFPQALPEFFINLCTEDGDVILDPFAGSNMTGRIAETLNRKWIAIEIEEEYVKGSKFRFEEQLLADTSNMMLMETMNICDLPLFKNSSIQL